MRGSTALERSSPTGFLSSVAGCSLRERERQARARDIVSLIGLEPYRAKARLGNLYVDTRRYLPTRPFAARPTTVGFLSRLAPAKEKRGWKHAPTGEQGVYLGFLARLISLTMSLSVVSSRVFVSAPG